MHLELKKLKEIYDESNEFNNYGDFLTKEIEKQMSNNNRMFQFDTSTFNSYTSNNFSEIVEQSHNFLRKNLEKYTTELVTNEKNILENKNFNDEYLNFDSEIKIIKDEKSNDNFFREYDRRLFIESNINFTSSYDYFFRSQNFEKLNERIKGNTYYEPFATYINKTKMGCVDFIYFSLSDLNNLSDKSQNEKIQISKILSYPYVKDIVDIDFNNLLEFPSDHIPLSVNIKIT